jgi:hypothetical protein
MIPTEARSKASRTDSERGRHTYHAPAPISSKGVRKASLSATRSARRLQEQAKMTGPHRSSKPQRRDQRLLYLKFN